MNTFRSLRWQPLALAAFALSLAACQMLPQEILSGSGYPNRYPDNRYPDDRDGRYGDYRSTDEYRRLGADADAYADQLDRQLDLNSFQRRAVEGVVESRTRDLLRETDPRNHYRVYPFPRSQAERRADGRRWWDGTDNGIERVLNDRQRQRYRQIASGDDRYDDRYDRDDNRSGRARGAVRPNRPDDRPSNGAVRPGNSNGRGRDAVRSRGNARSDRDDGRRSRGRDDDRRSGREDDDDDRRRGDDDE